MDTDKIISSQNIEELKDEIEQLTRILGSYNTDVEDENIGIIMGKFTDKQQIEFANEDAIKIFGFTKEQFKAEVLENFQPLELVEEKFILNDITNMLKINTPIRFKTKIKRRDGKKIRIVGNGSVIIDENGIKSCIFTFRSISNLCMTINSKTI